MYGSNSQPGQPMQMQQHQNSSPMIMPISQHGGQQHPQQQTHRQSPAMNQMVSQQPLSNNPASMIAPNTPQQQIYQQHMQPGSISHSSPYAMSAQSVSSNPPASQDYPQVSSNNPSVQSQPPAQPSSQQSQSQPSNTLKADSNKSDTNSPASTSANAGALPSPLVTSETDPWAVIRRLILYDLRHDLVNYSMAVSVLAREKFGIASEAIDLNTSGDSDRLKSVPPSSNINPLSVNPQSVAAPQSTNPMSVNAPNSVNDGDISAPGSINDSSGSESTSMAKLCPEEQYVNCRNKVLNTFDNIERIITTVNQAIYEICRLDSTYLASVPMDYTTMDVAQLQQKYIDEKRQNMEFVQNSVNAVAELRRQFHATLKTSASTTPPTENATGDGNDS